MFCHSVRTGTRLCAREPRVLHGKGFEQIRHFGWVTVGDASDSLGGRWWELPSILVDELYQEIAGAAQCVVFCVSS